MELYKFKLKLFNDVQNVKPINVLRCTHTFTCVKHENRIIYLVTPFRPFSKFNFPVQYLSICSVSFMVRFICYEYSTHTYAVIVTKTEIFVVPPTIFFNLLFEREILCDVLNTSVQYFRILL